MKKIIFILLLIFCLPLFAQKGGHDFPRTAWFSWSGVNIDHFDKFQLRIGNFSDSVMIKKYNLHKPGKVFLTTSDWNNGSIFQPTDRWSGNWPHGWWFLQHNDTILSCYNHTYDGYADITSYSSLFTGTITNKRGESFAINNESYTTAATRVMFNLSNPQWCDGLFTDGLRYYWYGWFTYPQTGGSDRWDINKDKIVNSDTAAERGMWDASAYHFLDSFKVKASRSPAWGYQRDSFLVGFWSISPGDTSWHHVVNSGGVESPWGQNSISNPRKWLSNVNRTRLDTCQVSRPHINIFLLSLNQDAGSGYPNQYAWNATRFWRWWMSIITATSNWYMGWDTYGQSPSGAHHPLQIFDEISYNLGQPVSQHSTMGVRLTGKAYADQNMWSDSCYVRFFDHGCVIANCSEYTRTVRLSDISGLVGYTGPYYRLFGNQDPNTNNGAVFDTVRLTARTNVPDPIDYFWNSLVTYDYSTINDGIFLSNVANTYAIEPIVLDNAKWGNSPNNDTTVIAGAWEHSENIQIGFSWNPRDSTPHYNIGRPNQSMNVYVSGSLGNHNDPCLYKLGATSATVSLTYRPIIRVTGDYAVYEWHAWLGKTPTAYSLSQHTPIKINHFGGSDSTTINQTINQAQWNYIGTYNFQVTSNNNIVLDNNSGETSRYVIGDAFKLVFVPPDYPSSSTKKVIFKKP